MPLYYELFHVGYRYRRLVAFLKSLGGRQRRRLSIDAIAFGFWIRRTLLGKGLGASQLKLLYLPDPHTDFIFPVIGEELGFRGRDRRDPRFYFWGLRGWQVAKRAPDLFGQLMAAGITCWVLLQATINMGVSWGLLPTKGLPLPFVSFGGSSLIITMAAVGSFAEYFFAGAWRQRVPPTARRYLQASMADENNDCRRRNRRASLSWHGGGPRPSTGMRFLLPCAAAIWAETFLRKEGFPVQEISGQGLPQSFFSESLGLSRSLSARLDGSASLLKELQSRLRWSAWGDIFPFR